MRQLALSIPARRTPFGDLPAKKFGVILADFPWLFRTYSKAGEGKSPQRHYTCHPRETILRFPMRDLAARDCALFLWVTWPTIRQAFDAIDAFGFTYKALGFDWVKWNPNTGKFAFGGGYGTRKNPEPCLLATRGSPPRLNADVRDLIFAPRREHSRKPDEQYERIERLYPGPYLELFARKQRPNWTSWGNQLGKFA